MQVGNDDDAVLLVKVTGQPEARHEIDMPSVQCEPLQTIIAAIRDHQHRVRASCIDPDTMGFIELAGI